MSEQQQPMNQSEKKAEEDDLIQLQGNLVNRLIKRVFKQKIVTSQFKKQFSRALSIFILYTQSGQGAKKKYKKDDILSFLEREGLGKVAEDLRKERICEQVQAPSRKKNDIQQNNEGEKE